MKRKTWFFLTAFPVFALDRFLKTVCENSDRVLLKGVLGIRTVHNTGIAMGLMSGRQWPLIVLTAALIIAITVFVVKSRGNCLFYIAGGLICGGALGNLVDRVAFGYVIDYIETLFMEFYIFNFADACITVGTVLTILSILLDPAPKKDEADEQ